MAISVSVILERKGGGVVTIEPDATVADAAARLAEHNIGALVVSEDGHTVGGILSERDIVRRLVDAGDRCLQMAVSEVMTADVATCSGGEDTDEVMSIMTNSRFRHMPVVDDDERLVGIVSIGDIVKSRIDELELQTESLREYVTGSAY